MSNLNSCNQIHNDGDHNQIPTQNHVTIHSENIIPFQSKVIAPTCSIEGNPSSDSSFLGHPDDTFTYDIHNAPDPDSLLYEILSRLPLKSVFQFKCVCKYWRTLIARRSFSRFYIARMLTANAALASLPFRIMYRYIYVKKIQGVLDLFRPENYNSSLVFLSRDLELFASFKVLAVSNGLILIWSFSDKVYHVCDPVTRQRVTLRRKRDESIFNWEGFVSRVNEDNVVTSYRIVRVETYLPPSNYLSLDMYTSETGKWVDYRLPCPNPILPRYGAGPLSFNGILHWFVNHHGMVAFDPYKDPKSCRLIPFPADRDVQSEVTHDGLYRLCEGCQGKLRFFQVAPDASLFYCFSMWDMKDYEKGEWCSEFKVTRSDLSSSDPELESWLMKATFLPLSFHPLDLDIVYLRCVELACVVSYSIQNRRLDVACKAAGVIDALSWRVVVPFVVPRWPTPIPISPVP
ncbi:putative F-box domain-containing protein [Helianthus annuus]|uniref:F-box domain-containing protein n=1 Tax=Helianthus annuus TaxID=4232 RepID=A0A251S718_HELAN|nr:putative F-box/kelch-repeat protein At1g15680 [Helianthus annuus]KAF5763845.1 putative F-box domain-containing protein [Helianthus annuus]KAJ0450608.1 putative F-box domain-containing protein [Helianthus annuus]KAJ0472459.1 putative F-box domain-containing protein [Helianthus annuus]KAJ0648060.1 putative F-box domain-containing protein [Helianthus annuus]KAJ0651905.1 putative F-box domain-containing protein [Helianthus annuus]